MVGVEREVLKVIQVFVCGIIFSAGWVEFLNIEGELTVFQAYVVSMTYIGMTYISLILAIAVLNDAKIKAFDGISFSITAGILFTTSEIVTNGESSRFLPLILVKQIFSFIAVILFFLDPILSHYNLVL